MSSGRDGLMGRGLIGTGKGPPEGRSGVNKKAGEPVAEQPTMRAVAIMSSQPALQDSAVMQRPGLSFVGPPPKGLFGRQGKADLKMARDGPSHGGLPGRPVMGDWKAGARTGSIVRMKEEWSGKVCMPSNWIVSGDTLHEVPFPLERTHRKIHGDAAEIASRISDALRKLSIEAEYDGEKAKAKCRTCDCACFRIRLYAGGEGGQPVVVEVQRRSGPGRSFMQSCRAILDAAEGNMSALEAATKKSVTEMRPCREMKCLQDIVARTSEEESASDVSFALGKIMELLRMKQYDSNLLGMEDLCILTDPLKSDAKLALEVSRYILLGDEEFSVREELSSLLDRDVMDPEFDQVSERGAMNLSEQLHHLALVVFSNSLSLTSREGCLEQSVQDYSWFREFLIPTLMEEVRNVDSSPNNACVASCCLNSLMSCSDAACSLIRDYGGVEAIGYAHEMGCRRHELLANETQRCMKILELHV